MVKRKKQGSSDPAFFMPDGTCCIARKKDENVHFLTIPRSLLYRILSQLGLFSGLKQTANAMAIRMILLHAREYPSGSTPKKSKLNNDLCPLRYASLTGNIAFSGHTWAHTAQPVHRTGSIFTSCPSIKNAGQASSLIQSLWFLHFPLT